MTETGEAAFLMYKYEGSTYKTTAESNWKNFGHDLKITSLELNNNVIKNFGLGNWEAASMVGGAFGGKIGIDFTLGDPWIFSALTGNIATSTGGGPYTHKFIDTSGSPATLATQKSMTLDLSYAFATASHLTISGAILDSLTMKLAVDEQVRCSAEMSFASAAWTEAAATTRVNPTDAAYTFAYASVEFPVSTTLTKVQSCDLTFTRNAEIKKGLGSRLGAFYVTKQAEYDMKLSLPFDIKTLLLYTFGAAASTSPDAILTETATSRILLNNGAATTANRQVDIQFTGNLINTLGAAASVEEMMSQEVGFSVRQLKLLQAINNVSTQPV